ncbi:MAG: hypothetical protein H7326_03470 [Bdellovibrionaceae bacterium]|nr:hypothetical protein [Pseudobdellovibrionaceae bacterium]
MAKVIVVAEKVNSTSWPLALSLRAQGHEVIFLTGRNETTEDTNGIRFMGYFKHWSVFEAVKLLPMIFSFEPQILHLILDRSRLKGAHVVLASYARSHPMMVLTTSLLRLEKRLSRGNPIRLLLQESDIITCPSVESLAKLRGLKVRSKRQGRGILPPALDLYDTSLITEEDDSDSEKEVVADENWATYLKDTPYFVVPCLAKDFNPTSSFFMRVSKMAESHFVVLLGSNQDWPLRSRKLFDQWMNGQGLADRWMFSGTVPKIIEKQMLRHSLCLILAGLKLSAEEISLFYTKAIQTNTALVLDSKQASVHAHLWQRNVNCWILNHEALDKELREFLTKADFRPPESLQNKLSTDHHITDTPLNELNRLYTRALAQLK